MLFFFTNTDNYTPGSRTSARASLTASQDILIDALFQQLLLCRRKCLRGLGGLVRVEQLLLVLPRHLLPGASHARIRSAITHTNGAG